MIETKRLILKEPFEGEVDLVAPLQADPMVMRYIWKGTPRSLSDVQGALKRNLVHWEAFGYGFWNVFEKDSGEFVGRAGLLHLAYNPESPDIEVGYHLHQKFWGKGYATEFANALLAWGFEHIDTDHFVGVTWKENTASQNVLKKVGMEFDRELIYPGTDFNSNLYIKKR